MSGIMDVAISISELEYDEDVDNIHLYKDDEEVIVDTTETAGNL